MTFLKHPYKKNLISVSILMLLSLILLSPEIFFLIKAGQIGNLIINFLLILSFILIPTVFFYKKLPVYYLLIIAFCSITPIFFLPLLLLNQRADGEMIELAINSNFREIRELLGWNILTLIILICSLFTLIYKLTKALPAKIHLKKSIFISFAGIFVFAVLLLKNIETLPRYFFTANTNLHDNYPFRVIMALGALQKERILEKNYLKNTASFNFGASKRQPEKRRIHVLVIGESSRYNQWGINGYARNTSPYLSAEKNLVSFDDVASGAPVTYKSVPLLLTRGGVENLAMQFTEKGILKAFKEAGFYTAWISNQDRGDKIAKRFYTNDADMVIFPNETFKGDLRFMRTGLYDEVLIDHLNSILQNVNGDIFIILHTMGSHWFYQYRYPPEFDVFKTDENISTDNISANALVNSYDNSILYTDYFLHKVINVLKNNNIPGSLLYVSDHGENLKDNSENLLFHYAPKHYALKVPLFIWLSDSLIQEKPNLLNSIINNKNKPVSSAGSVFYTNLDLCGIDIKGDEKMAKLSLCSPDYENNNQKVLTENNEVIFFKDLPK